MENWTALNWIHFHTWRFFNQLSLKNHLKIKIFCFSPSLLTFEKQNVTPHYACPFSLLFCTDILITSLEQPCLNTYNYNSYLYPCIKGVAKWRVAIGTLPIYFEFRHLLEQKNNTQLCRCVWLALADLWEIGMHSVDHFFLILCK